MEEKTRKVYILLTRSNTSFSQLIYKVTHDQFTHSSIGLEGPGGAFYSFARRHPRLMLPAGLIKERVAGGFYAIHPTVPCRLYELEVTEENWQYIRRKIDAMYPEHRHYRYNLLGAFTAYAGKTLERPHHYFCSEFVAECLVESGAAVLPNPPGLSHPIDFTTIEGEKLLFEWGRSASWPARSPPRRRFFEKILFKWGRV